MQPGIRWLLPSKIAHAYGLSLEIHKCPLGKSKKERPGTMQVPGRSRVVSPSGGRCSAYLMSIIRPVLTIVSVAVVAIRR